MRKRKRTNSKRPRGGIWSKPRLLLVSSPTLSYDNVTLCNAVLLFGRDCNTMIGSARNILHNTSYVLFLGCRWDPLRMDCPCILLGVMLPRFEVDCGH